MALYIYKSEDGKTIEKEMSMMENHPSSIEENGVMYYRDFSNGNSVTITVPYHMKAGNGFKFNYSKAPSRKKHYF